MREVHQQLPNRPADAGKGQREQVLRDGEQRGGRGLHLPLHQGRAGPQRRWQRERRPASETDPEQEKTHKEAQEEQIQRGTAPGLQGASIDSLRPVLLYHQPHEYSDLATRNRLHLRAVLQWRRDYTVNFLPN